MTATIIEFTATGTAMKVLTHQETPLGQAELAMNEIEDALGVLERHVGVLAHHRWPFQDRLVGVNVLLASYERRLWRLREAVLRSTRTPT